MFFSMDAEPRADAPLCAVISVAVGTTAAMPAACKNPRLVISCMVSPSCRDLQSWNFQWSKSSRLEIPSFLRLFEERLAEASAVSDFRKRFAVLFPLTDSFGRISERDNGEHVQIAGDAQDRLDIVEPHEADPVRSDAFRPCGEDHRLNRAGSVGHREFGSMNGNNNSQRSLGNIGTRTRH